jgi:alpha-tubulin suppressor-like RCC1 family protein
VFAWGFNGAGELGNGTTAGYSPDPGSVLIPPGTIITAIGAGDEDSLALTSTGSVLAWGFNRAGQLGNGTTTDSAVPVSVLIPPGITITAVAAGAYHNLALTSTGSVLAWGSNGTGQLGNGGAPDNHVPVSVLVPPNITAVAAGSSHSLALSSTGSVYAWGANSSGQLGNGTGMDSTTPLPVRLPSGTTITAIAAGGAVAYPPPGISLALTSSGSVLAWGYNGDGELGNGSYVNSALPVPVSLPSGTIVTAVAAGWWHSLAIVR